MEAWNFYLLRTTKMPLNLVRQLNSFQTETQLKRFLHQLFQSREMQESISLVSSDLYNRLRSWFENPAEDISDKLLLALYKYSLRMASRATPFGRFSGVSLGEISNNPSSVILSGEIYPMTRLDMEFSAHIADHLHNDPSIRRVLNFYPNNTLHNLNDHYRYFEHRKVNGRKKYFMVRVTKNPLIDSVIETAESGGTIEILAQKLINIGIDETQAIHFIETLVENQLLVSDLEANVTGADYFETIFKRIGKHNNHLAKAHPVNQISEMLNYINEGRRLTIDLKNRIDEMFPEIPFKNYFQTDLKIGVVNNTINKDVIDTLKTEIHELFPLNKSTVPKDFQIFKDRFLARYGTREIPLLEALDYDLGLGYGESEQFFQDSILIRGIEFKKERKDKYELFFDKFLAKHFSSGKKLQSIQLDQTDFEGFSNTGSDRYPSSFYVLGNLLMDTDRKMPVKDFQFNLLACGGKSSIPLMARFSAIDNRLEEKLQQCVDFEASCFKDTIVAEIVHMPESKIGNILKRPSFREYEIPILSQSLVSRGRQIPLSDLYLSLKNEMLILYSRRLGKRIIPRLSCAHNYTRGISVYRFLCDIQSQEDQMNIKWDWGRMNNCDFLPRVTYKHIILSRARWRIPRLFLDKIEGVSHLQAMSILKEAFCLPECVTLAEGDNELFIDLACLFAFEILLENLKKGDVILYEFLSVDNVSFIKDKQGNKYINEIVIPFKNKPRENLEQKMSDEKLYIHRSFPPGSEWAYLKIYCGQKQIDRILTEDIKPLVSNLESSGLIRKWFFIRYHDPDSHLRIRFQLPVSNMEHVFGELLSMVNQELSPLLENGLIYRMQFDTYERELERYGVDTMAICESIFHLDSRAVLSLLSIIRNYRGEDNRWLSAMLGIDQVLWAFGLNIREKLNITDSWRDAFLKEFDVDQKFKISLNEKFRELRGTIEASFKAHYTKEDAVQRVFENRKTEFQEYADQLQEVLGKTSWNTDPKKIQILSSLCHMFLNRIFYSNHREHELMLYHMLGKYYLSLLKRSDQRVQELQAMP